MECATVIDRLQESSKEFGYNMVHVWYLIEVHFNNAVLLQAFRSKYALLRFTRKFLPYKALCIKLLFFFKHILNNSIALLSKSSNCFKWDIWNWYPLLKRTITSSQYKMIHVKFNVLFTKSKKEFRYIIIYEK